MPLRLGTIYKNSEWLYQVCADADNDRIVLETIITAVGWQSLYFEMTPEQIALIDTDIEALTDLASEMTVDRGKRKFAEQLIDISTYNDVEHIS